MLLSTASIGTTISTSGPRNSRKVNKAHNAHTQPEAKQPALLLDYVRKGCNPKLYQLPRSLKPMKARSRVRICGRSWAATGEKLLQMSQIGCPTSTNTRCSLPSNEDLLRGWQATGCHLTVAKRLGRLFHETAMLGT